MPRRHVAERMYSDVKNAWMYTSILPKVFEWLFLVTHRKTLEAATFTVTSDCFYTRYDCNYNEYKGGNVHNQSCCNLNDQSLTSPHRVSVASDTTIGHASVSVTVLTALFQSTWEAMTSREVFSLQSHHFYRPRFLTLSWTYNMTILCSLVYKADIFFDVRRRCAELRHLAVSLTSDFYHLDALWKTHLTVVQGHWFLFSNASRSFVTKMGRLTSTRLRISTQGVDKPLNGFSWNFVLVKFTEIFLAFSNFDWKTEKITIKSTYIYVCIKTLSYTAKENGNISNGQFKSRSGHTMSLLRSFMIFLSPTRTISRYWLSDSTEFCLVTASCWFFT
jgi:hypothetical protein